MRVCVFCVGLCAHLLLFVVVVVTVFPSFCRKGGENGVCAFLSARASQQLDSFFFPLVASHIFIQTVLLHCVFHGKCQHHFRKKKNNSVFIILIA